MSHGCWSTKLPGVGCILDGLISTVGEIVAIRELGCAVAAGQAEQGPIHMLSLLTSNHQIQNQNQQRRNDARTKEIHSIPTQSSPRVAAPLPASPTCYHSATPSGLIGDALCRSRNFPVGSR